MKSTILSVRDAFVFGWNVFRSRPWFFVRVGLVLVGISVLVGVGEDLLRIVLSESAVDAIVTLDTLITTALFSAGTTALFLKAHDSAASATLRDLWIPRVFWQFIALTIVGGAATILGFVFLIIPGIFLLIAFSFSDILVIEKNRGPLEALKESWHLTHGHRMQLLIFGIAALLLNILGLVVLLVGILVTLPVTSLALIHIYRSINTEKHIDSLEVVT